MAVIGGALIAGAAAAYGANRQNSAAKKAAKAASAPTNWSQTTNPYSPYAQNLDLIATDARNTYLQHRDNATPPPTRGSYGGYGGGGGVSGASDLENQLANSAGQRAMGTNQLLDSASGSLQGLYGGSSNPMLQQAFNNAQSFTNPYLNEQVARQQRGSGSRASGLLEGLYGEWAGAGAVNAGNDAYNRYYSQGQQAPTNTTQQGGGDIFSGMTNTSPGRRVSGAGRFSSGGGGGGGGGQAGPKSPLQEAYEAEMLRTMRGEYQNADSNPYLQQQIDQAKREADAALAERNLALGAEGESLGRFGSSPYLAMAQQNNKLYNEQYLDRASDLRFENYGNERDIMQQALDRMLAQNTAEMQDRTANKGISASARSQADALDAQMAMARDQNKLQALGLLGQFEGQNQDYLGNLLGTQTQAGLSALGLQGQLGQAAGANQISALGLAPSISDSYYTGYGVAGGLAGQVRQGNQAAQSANAAAQQAAADAAYQDAMAQWQWQQSNQYDNLNNLYNLTIGPAQAFGSSSGQQQGPAQVARTTNPWAAGLAGAVGSFASAYGSGGFGGGAAKAAPDAVPYYLARP